jgi:predicted glycosyltransferase
VISTAGYNTCTDLLSMAKAAILIPRVLYRQEQWIRASRFAELGLATCIHPSMVQPDSLFEAIQRARKEPMLQWARNKGLPIDGAERFAEFCGGLMVQAEVG